MLLEEMNAMSYSWNFLQQPIHPGQGMNASFWSLLAAIDQDWQVHEPVTRTTASLFDSPTYHFLLTHKKSPAVCRIAIPATPEIDRFIRTNNYQVEDAGRPKI